MKKNIILFASFFLLLAGSVHGESMDGLDGKISMSGDFLDGNLLRINVLSDDFTTPILGMAFHLRYEDEKLDFLRYEPGDFLERGGDPFYLVNKGKNNDVVFGATLRRDDNFPIGGGKVSSFYFQIIEEGQFHFSFDRGVVSTIDMVRQDLSNIVWDDFFIERPLEKSYASVIDSGQYSEGGFVQIFTMIVISVFSLLFALFILKKYGNKRHNSYVNFK